MPQTYLQEIFSSVQGEGPYVGCRQIFIRFAGCNWSCAFCDTPSNEKPEVFTIENSPGQRDFTTHTNPMSAEALSAILKERYKITEHHSISFTGGEPLLQTEFLATLIPFIKGTRQGIYLETNGTLPEKLANIIDSIDIVSMDIKLQSSTGIVTPWDLHHRFLQVAAQRKVYVKIVITSETAVKEIQRAAELIGRVDSGIELVLQPVTPKGGCQIPAVDQILKLQQIALDHLANVRVIPQTHLMMGQL
ncbi:7-carboxy-7-deazaguanine synthase QueE [Desulforamulus aeronauticus]|uniref:7-carboxy-7-deazaguanine synthase n=1 Tax=Desulforamulus aeronauticus DSM 10349 TaxID=1121421 RepID=A0A1M6NEX9_9FIRM|nr:7-carboxy-7-deazaguanine synthase QueE [Desulforamulus aeronauticus]SHJ94189.1 Organic radical activating enzyme [Desulforamulus aeronauticus DSM 10349]